ncbi:DNA replication protein DnaC [subsurface metagenome]
MGKHELGQGLFFTGPNGTGKTHLAVAILRELSLKGKMHWFFVKTPYLLMRIRQAFKKESSDSEESLIDQFVDYDYLAIDELGVEKITDWSLQTLYLIIDGRNDRLKSTIITSNLDLPEIEKKIDPRIASRIVEMCRVIKFECDDWRIRMRRKR